MNVISRADAKAEGLTRFFTGKPCGNGHIAEKLVSNYWCVECQRVAIAAKSDRRLAKQKEWRDTHKDHTAEYAATKRPWSKRRAARLNAVPAWYGELDQLAAEEAANLCARRESATGIKWEVDHMLPLQGKTVSGLHVGINLQVIPAVMNRAKHNRMRLTEPGEWVLAMRR